MYGRGVLVVNQSGANAEAVAEHTVAMMLTLTKNIMQTDHSLRKERGVDRERFKGRNAQGRTVGIIGLGNVGRQVARICSKGLDMRVLAYDPYLTAAEFRSAGRPRSISIRSWHRAISSRSTVHIMLRLRV